MDPDLVRFPSGDTQLEQHSRNATGSRGRKRMETEINKHHQLVNSLQKLNFMKGLIDTDSSLGGLPYEDYFFEQVKLLNFVYANIFTRYHQQEKLLATTVQRVPRGLALKDKQSSSSDEDETTYWQRGVDSSANPYVPPDKRKRKKKSKKKKKTPSGHR
jgi:hypothetical protein